MTDIKLHGPGKYDPLCTKVREESQADGAIVIVFRGIFGNGFSVQGTAAMIANLPQILRNTASQIEAEMQGRVDA